MIKSIKLNEKAYSVKEKQGDNRKMNIDVNLSIIPLDDTSNANP